MTTQIRQQGITNAPKEQRFVLPGCHDWGQFKAIQALMAKQPGLRISYLDGIIELMTIGEKHEIIKSLIALLLGLYFFHKQIEFIPVGSATRESEEKRVSFEPDESYYIGEKKENPDLAIEVNITSGNSKKLARYKRFKITEVWIWHKNTINVYALRDRDDESKIRYEKIDSSELLVDLDLRLLEDCILIPSKLEAMNKFTQLSEIDERI